MTYPLEPQRLSISPLTAADLRSFVEYRSDPEIARYQGWDAPYSETKASELIESQAGIDLPPKGEWLQLAIHLSSTGELIGDLALHALDESHEGYEIGFTVAKRFQGQGYAKEATTVLIENLVCEFGAKRFIATPDNRNVPSIRLLESLGFIKRPEKSWDELFKGENVTVDYFELVHAVAASDGNDRACQRD